MENQKTEFEKVECCLIYEELNKLKLNGLKEYIRNNILNTLKEKYNYK